MDNTQEKPFEAYDHQIGLLNNLLDNKFPAKLYAWHNTKVEHLQENASFLGFVSEGLARIKTDQGVFDLTAGMYFCVPKKICIEGKSRGFLIEQRDFNGFLHIGGPIESKGRLRYIDGCTDSLLIAPPIMGNPCLNLLNIPANTFQTQHTHPSFRIGMVVKGTGVCITPKGNSPLKPGLIFVIPEEALHSFKTEEHDLLIIAYHPDSDFGPTHENHPMINRTIIKYSVK
ncbi:MAG: AraC family ligand binding domain-containing protein [Saprospiraceae bacterium]|nr:AraC family ligand binding domain-containing protein [Saprospiraceae bacterium]